MAVEEAATSECGGRGRSGDWRVWWPWKKRQRWWHVRNGDGGGRERSGDGGGMKETATVVAAEERVVSESETAVIFYRKMKQIWKIKLANLSKRDSRNRREAEDGKKKN